MKTSSWLLPNGTFCYVFDNSTAHILEEHEPTTCMTGKSSKVMRNTGSMIWCVRLVHAHSENMPNVEL